MASSLMFTQVFHQLLTESTIFCDRNAMKNRKYYEENLSCHVLRLRRDGVRVETISLFGQGSVADKTGCTLAHCSDSSSDSGSGSMNSASPTIWSKLFGSRRSTGSLRHSPASVMGSSRTSSNLGSPRPLVQEENEAVAEVLEESFSFDSPVPNPAAEAYVYAAAGLDHKFGSYAGNRNGESSNLPTALTA